MRGPPPDSPTSDAALLDALRRGNQDALAVLYDRHAASVLAFAFRYCDDRDQAEDVVQDCFAELLERIQEFELTGQLTSWFFVVARRRALRLRERARRAQGELGPQALAIPAEGPPETADLRKLLARLPAGQQEVLVLRYLDGLDLAEISEVLDIPVGTAKSRIHNALAAMKEDPACKKYFNREID